MIERLINHLERKLTHFWLISIAPFLNTSVLTGELATLKNEFVWTQLFLFGFISLKLRTCFEFANATMLFVVFLTMCCNNVDEHIVENRIEIDRPEAEVYESTHELRVFS